MPQGPVDNEALAYDMAVAMHPYMTQAVDQQAIMVPLHEDRLSGLGHTRVRSLQPGDDFVFPAPWEGHIENPELVSRMDLRVNALIDHALAEAGQVRQRYYAEELAERITPDQVAQFVGVEPDEFQDLGLDERIQALEETQRVVRFIHGVVDIMKERGVMLAVSDEDATGSRS